ncbi:hypothetical protein TPAU25S_03178 [Tsukamurella paurometabola]|uniref:IrrE N-terminal-like domain-containing protein n=1 Tax=Tsukamurella paurometabola (strain ATCC 8368 / DSM 20162 / CCUG 35730 / CIP 100753 / JCM 10117 / KCTC 9821 / NBRC 16120 / NCIMB 702349 / NCTC 13040) TaxID=521096 RepID=D5UYF8_TSUPD|nr:ImmA/IrrE family metallo-endopeptidase [Tsukamurella paurometabola]ADG78265.1 hypothetical protein Tpau_1644 [Tsukamurella paurometabola DSM 20162]SUP30935.1 Domain of uncharacterised function (DUF955) [Tsukamurella paurometabola]
MAVRKLPLDRTTSASLRRVAGELTLLVNSDVTETIRTFATATLLGHYVLMREREAHRGGDRPDFVRTYPPRPPDPHADLFANAFACHFLMPKEALDQAWNAHARSATATADVARTFGVPVPNLIEHTMRIRYRTRTTLRRPLPQPRSSEQ